MNRLARHLIPSAVATYFLLFVGYAVLNFSHSVRASDMSADFDSSDTVDNADLSILRTNWHNSNTNHSTGDTDDNGTTDIFDFSNLVFQYGQFPPGGGQPANSISVLNYGVTNNGDADDDTTNLLAAFNAANSQGKIAWIPNGTYKVNDITIPNGLTIQGESIDTVWLKGTLYYGSNDTVRDLKIGDLYASTRNGPNATNTLFERVHFRGGGESGVSWPNNSVLIIGSQYSASNITFRTCIIERNLGGDADFSKGFNDISLLERSNVHVDTITIEKSTVGASNGVSTGSPRMDIEAYVDDDGNLTRGFQNITLKNNTFKAADAHTIDFSDAPSGRGNNINIEGNTIEGGGITKYQWGYGLCLEMPLNTTVKNNTFTRAWLQALNITNRNDSSYTGPATQITGNTFDFTLGTEAYGAGEPAIVLKGSNNVFTGNTIKGGWSPSIVSLWIAYNNNVTNNTFSQRNGATPVLVNSGTGNTITPNTIQ